MGAKMRAETARQEARKAARAADRAEAEAWSVRMEVGAVVPMPVMRHAPLQAARPYDQGDRAAGDHAV